MASTTTYTALNGLPGNNPLGFMAALGVQMALEACGHQHSLHWSSAVIPTPIISPAVDKATVLQSFQDVSREWLRGPVFDRGVDDKLKLKPPAIRAFLERGRRAGPAGVLAGCLVAEGSLDNKGNAKPTDFYFTAGNQRFLGIARDLLSDTSDERIWRDISSTWEYDSQQAPLMWDSTDDRLHAYSASDPSKKSKNPKMSNPGGEALAIVGLANFPCFASPERTVTRGTSGKWKLGRFVWPVWRTPASSRVVRTLIAQCSVPTSSGATRRMTRRIDTFDSWGIQHVYQSQIRRSSQGGYGTFGPSRIIWQRD